MPEFIIANWSPTFFRMEGAIDVQGAGYILSIFWALLITGRIIVSFLSSKLKSVYIMLMLALISLISTVFLVFSTSSLSIYLFIGLTGLGYSGLYPLLFYDGSTVYRKGRGSLASLILLSSGTGQSFASYLDKIISKHNMLLSVFMAVISLAVLLVLIVVLIFYKKTNPIPDK